MRRSKPETLALFQRSAAIAPGRVVGNATVGPDFGQILQKVAFGRGGLDRPHAEAGLHDRHVFLEILGVARQQMIEEAVAADDAGVARLDDLVGQRLSVETLGIDLLPVGESRDQLAEIALAEVGAQRKQLADMRQLGEVVGHHLVEKDQPGLELQRLRRPLRRCAG
jgi:hypothetical protein